MKFFMTPPLPGAGSDSHNQHLEGIICRLIKDSFIRRFLTIVVMAFCSNAVITCSVRRSNLECSSSTAGWTQIASAGRGYLARARSGL